MTDDDEPDDDVIVARRWSWVVLGGLSANFVSNLADAVSTFFDGVDAACASHVTMDDEHRKAYAELHRDLETL